jgi:hypothetical protein
VWLRAEKFRRQGPSRGFGRQPTGSSQRHYSGKLIEGGKVQTEKEESVIRGNPTSDHLLNEVRAANSLNLAENLSKIDGGVVNAGNKGLIFSTGMEGFTEVSNGKENQGKGLGKPALRETNGDPGLLSWAQQGVNGHLPRVGPTQFTRLCGEFQPQSEKAASLVPFLNANITVRQKGSLTAQNVATANPSDKMVGQNERDTDIVNITELGMEENYEGNNAVFSYKTELEEGNKTVGEVGVQSIQERNKNIPKVWKRVTRSGEEEKMLENSNQALLGKRKGEIEELNGEEQRHLKIRKWEDYLEEESENEEETAEAALQPRQQP